MRDRRFQIATESPRKNGTLTLIEGGETLFDRGHGTATGEMRIETFDIEAPVESCSEERSTAVGARIALSGCSRPLLGEAS
jgi:hypothetical protein